MTLVPRLLPVWMSAAVIAAAIVLGAVQAVLVGVGVLPRFAAIALGVLICPSMLRGARIGSMPGRVAAVVVVVGAAVPVLATWSLDPARATYLTVSWYSCGVLAGAMLVWMSGQRLATAAGVTALVVQTLLWAGPEGLVRLGVVAEVLLLGAMIAVHRTIRLVEEAAAEAASAERRLILWEAEQDALRVERRQRLRDAAEVSLPLLHRIVERRGDLDDAVVTECRLLEQTLRDEIRGRRLLNDRVRSAVLAHRRRGATVQILDDGGLDGLAALEVAPLLDELAARIEPLRSDRIVIRTGASDGPQAVTVAATSAAHPGADSDEDAVDLWASLPRPAAEAAPVRP